MGGNKLPVKGRERFDWEKQQQLFWYDRYHTAMTSLAYSFQKTDRVLTGNLDIKVKATTSMHNGMQFPGFTTGDVITINYDKFKSIGSASTLVALMGLNYHELSHWMFTPRAETMLRKWMFQGNDRELFHYWNVLEDQRIESLFRAIYRPAGKHFTQMIIEFIVDDKDQWPLGHAMVYGRKFIPLEIRQGFKERWVGTVAERKQCEQIIDKFKGIDWAFLTTIADPERNPYAVEAKELVRKFKKLIEAIQQRTSKKLADTSECSNNNPNASAQDQKSGGAEKPGAEEQEQSRRARDKMKEQEEEQDKTEEGGEDGSGHWDDVDDDSEDSDDVDVEESESEQSGSGAGEDPDDSSEESASEGSEDSGEWDDSEDGSDDAGDGGESDADDSGTSGPAGREGDDSDSDDEPSGDDSDSSGVGSDPNAPETENQLSDEEFEEALEDIINSLEEHKQLQEDIAQMRGALADPTIDLDEDIHPTMPATVEEASRSAAVGVEREFSRLYAELEPGWKYGSDTGKLNVERWVRDHDYDDAFDEWDEGKQQDTGIEAVILLDTSSSMETGNKIGLACQATWVLKKSLDTIDAKVSVITFDAITRALYKRGDTVNPHEVLVPTHLGGSTIPNMALHTARRILGESALPNKILIAVTDGGWQKNLYGQLGGEDESHEKIMESIDALKLYFMIGGSNVYRSITEYFDISRDVGSPVEIVPVVAEAVNHILEETRNQ